MFVGGNQSLNKEIEILDELIAQEHKRLSEPPGAAQRWEEAIAAYEAATEAITNKDPAALTKTMANLGAILKNGESQDVAALNLRKMLQEKARLIAATPKARRR